MPAVLRNYTPVTEARLRSPNDGDWMMNRRTYDGWGYSPLTQITPANVARLKPVWSFSTGAVNGHEAAPIVHDGVMFVATPGSQVIAIEAATGTVLWRYRRPLGPTARSCGALTPVPAPGEPGSDTWPKGGEQWKTGGGSVWVTGNYDPENQSGLLGHGQRRTPRRVSGGAGRWRGVGVRAGRLTSFA